jgi:hypothetical protein
MTSRGGAASASRLIDTAPPASPPRVVFLVPRRADGGHRDRLWAWCKPRWEREHPDWPVIEGHHTIGPFNRSAAINAASDIADGDGAWDVAVVIDADVIVPPEQVREAVARAQRTGRVIWAFNQRLGLSEKGTEKLLAGDAFDERFVETRHAVSWSMCFAVPRTAWDTLGGFDERFIGWGYEDMAFKTSVLTLIQPDDWTEHHVAGPVTHLWHPRSDERAEVRLPGGWIKITPEYLDNTVLGRRYMDAAGEPDVIRSLLAGAARQRDENRYSRGRTTTVVIHTDGRRQYLERCVESFLANVTGPIIKKVFYDDSGDPEYKAWLDATYGELGIGAVGPAQRLGFGGSMASMWRYLDRRCVSDFVFMVEDDFVFDRPVDLVPMIDTLRENPHLRQVALLRGPAYPREIEAGGIIEQYPERYTPIHQNGHSRIEHREYFTTNPCVFRRSLVREQPWPDVASSERVYTATLNRDPQARFAYWGDGAPWIRHIGAERAGTGY